jgi:hypothetical protein
VSEAVIAGLDRHWRPLPGSEKTLQVDTVAMGYGFVPNSELSRMAGCEHSYNAAQGGWVPDRGPGMHTTVAGIYSAGDGAGVAGALVAELEGRLAGLSALKQLGLENDGAGEARRLHRRLRAMARFRRAMDRVSLLRPGLLALAAPETIICRCEEVRLADITEALAQGSRNLDNIKRRTRAGMGMCQGRICLPFVAALAAQASARNSAMDSGKDGATGEGRAGWHRPRPPLRPVPLSALAGEGVQKLEPSDSSKS